MVSGLRPLERNYLTPASAKSKGRIHQQWVRDTLLTLFPELEKDDIRSTSMGMQGEDLQLSPAARRVFPYQVEAKSKVRSQTHTWYDQAKTHGSNEPIVVVKMDRKERLVVVEAEHFFKLVRELYEYRSKS